MMYGSDMNDHVLSEVHTDCQFQILPNSNNAVHSELPFKQVLDQMEVFWIKNKIGFRGRPVHLQIKDEQSEKLVITRFKINLHELKVKSEGHDCKRKAVKLETNEKLQIELIQNTKFGNEEEKETYNLMFEGTEHRKEKFDADGDLILDRHSCRNLNINEDGHCHINYKICKKKNIDKNFDKLLAEDYCIGTQVKKKIKLEFESSDNNSIIHAENNGKRNFDCLRTENTQNGKSVTEILQCQHCNVNNDGQDSSVVYDRINVCKSCVNQEHYSEGDQTEVEAEMDEVAESNKNTSDISVEPHDNDSVIYYLNIKHSLSTELNSVGEQVWHGSLLLSDYIICNHGNFDDKVIIDLGAGVGLSSIVAAMYAKMVYCTDTGEKILSLAESNVLTARTCPTLPRKLCDVHVKELDWYKGIEEDSSMFGLTKNDVDRIKKSDILIAADVFYDFDITDAFFNLVKQIMNHPPCKTLYIGLEKRIVFTCEDLSVSSPGYNYFRLHLDDLCSRDDDDTDCLFEVEQIDPSFPQLFQYNRIRQLELWKITASFKS